MDHLQLLVNCKFQDFVFTVTYATIMPNRSFEVE